MQLVVKIEDGKPAGLPLLAENVRVCYEDLPQGFLTSETLAAIGYASVTSVTCPIVDDPTKEVVPATPDEQLADSSWLQKWQVTGRQFADETERATAQAAAVEVKAGRVRAERNRLIAASDWAVLPDSSADKSAWAAYRQALRDVTEQPDFPESVEWPTAPNDERADV